ncbi:hypothetical protein OG758_26010 [Streptomyces sp. NBC_01474]|uniref:hypothetical protein n=1 Tax=unclassified Streptomyces TaxID=2593676 RepID=UPI002DDA9E7A|nr:MULTISPECIES: hypothetical protein [unclassified Streptomyces]WSD97305.1 hypothetical protein OG758_26010 [Streptomyces sp. NBC_01474]
MSAPIVAAALFNTVMEAAGHRCQCAGQCGNAHTKGKGRCPHEHDGYTSKHGRRVRLIAAPADPLTSAVAAAGLPPAELRAWCLDCLTTAARAAKRQLPATSTDQCGLFDL